LTLPRVNPATNAPPNGIYSHSVKVPANAEWLVMAGQVGVAPDGSIPEGMLGQAEVAFNNIKMILDHHGWDMTDVIMLTCFLTSLEDRQEMFEVRKKYFPEPYPCSTFLVVSSLANPDFIFEAEATAARVPS
jgi:2-iminobutanoate/2-iminopropanoate deaminase